MIKFLTIVICFSGLCLLTICREMPSAKIVRANCSTSGVGTCINPFCTVKPVSRYQSYFSFGCENISRPLTKLFLEYKMSYKRMGNYYQVIDVKPMEFCEFANIFIGKKNHPLLKLLMDTVPSLVHLCPYKDGDFQLVNDTFPPGKAASGPDGYYKSFFSAKDDIDKNLFSITWVMQLSNKHDVVGFK